MRRLLNQAANAAVKVKGGIFEIVFRRLLPRLGFKQAIWAMAHRLSRPIWKILHQGVCYDERGPAVSQKSRGARTGKMIRELRSLGYLGFQRRLAGSFRRAGLDECAPCTYAFPRFKRSFSSITTYAALYLFVP
jgi:hypothetical protein